MDYIAEPIQPPCGAVILSDSKGELIQDQGLKSQFVWFLHHLTVVRMAGGNLWAHN